jgi:iron complex outermembrane receptor protein
MEFQRRKVAALLGVAGCSWLAGGLSQAQDIRVNVTGSNIKRVDTETAAPIETITREQINQTGFQTISEVVRSITANNNGTIANEWSFGFPSGGAGVSLRGLGSNNTLVLLNGRRLANYGLADDGHYSFVDLNQVPFDAVERIEILKDGASAIYGSDAVAGVVNVILRQQYTGFTANATAGTSYKGDGTQYRGAVTWGMGDLTKDRYNFFATVDAQKQEAMPSTNRRQYIGTTNLEFMGLPDTRPGNPPLGWGTTSPLGNVRPVAGNNLTGPTLGAYQSLPGYCAPENQSDGFCKWDTKQFLDVQPEVQKINVFARGSFNFTDTTQGYAELSWFQSKVNSTISPNPLRVTAWPDVANSSIISSLTTINLPVGHPDNPFAANGQGARLYYAPFDIGGRTADTTAETQRYLAGVKGSNAGWDWDVGGLYIRSNLEYGLDHYITIRTSFRRSTARAASGTTGSARTRASTTRASTASSPRASPTTSSARTRSSTRRPRATSISSTAASQPLRSATSGGARRSTIRACPAPTAATSWGSDTLRASGRATSMRCTRSCTRRSSRTSR